MTKRNKIRRIVSMDECAVADYVSCMRREKLGTGFADCIFGKIVCINQRTMYVYGVIIDDGRARTDSVVVSLPFGDIVFMHED